MLGSLFHRYWSGRLAQEACLGGSLTKISKDQFTLSCLSKIIWNKIKEVYFTKNSGYRSLKNRSCVIVFGSLSVTLTVGELFGDVSGSANHDFRTLVTRISDEIDAS